MQSFFIWPIIWVFFLSLMFEKLQLDSEGNYHHLENFSLFGTTLREHTIEGLLKSESYFNRWASHIIMDIDVSKMGSFISGSWSPLLNLMAQPLSGNGFYHAGAWSILSFLAKVWYWMLDIENYYYRCFAILVDDDKMSTLIYKITSIN